MPKKSQTAKVIESLYQEIADHEAAIAVLRHAIAKLEEVDKKVRAA